MRNSQRLLILVLLLGGVLPLFANSQAAALAIDQVTSTLSALRTATVTTTSTSHLTQTRTASTTIATTTSYIDLTRTQPVLTTSTTTSYVSRYRFTTSTSLSNITRTATSTFLVGQTKTATATTTIATTTTNHVSQTGTITAPTTVATATNYVNQTNTTTASTTVATTTNYISQTKTTTSTSSLNQTRTATATSLVNQTKTTTVPTTVATTTNYVGQTATTSSSTTTTTLVTATNTVTATSTITTSTTSTQSTAPTTPTGLLIPLFIYPTTVSTWSSIAALPAAYPNVPVIAIVNPANGVGASKDLNYVAAINSLKSSGVITIGYITTNYGAVPLQSVKTSIDLWKSYYGVTGIFLDAMANTPGLESYYQSIETYAKVADGMNIVIGNPGTETIASYIGNGGVDNIGFYENSGTPTIAYLSSPFHTSYPKTEWSFICYGVGTLNDTYIMRASHYVSYLYVASGAFPNPWNTIPSYLNQMAADLARVNPPALSIKASQATIASNANPDRTNDNPQFGFGCIAKCVPNIDSSYTFNSQNVSVHYPKTPAKEYLRIQNRVRPPSPDFSLNYILSLIRFT